LRQPFSDFETVIHARRARLAADAGTLSRPVTASCSKRNFGPTFVLDDDPQLALSCLRIPTSNRGRFYYGLTRTDRMAGRRSPCERVADGGEVRKLARTCVLTGGLLEGPLDFAGTPAWTWRRRRRCPDSGAVREVGGWTSWSVVPNIPVSRLLRRSVEPSARFCEASRKISSTCHSYCPPSRSVTLDRIAGDRSMSVFSTGCDAKQLDPTGWRCTTAFFTILDNASSTPSRHDPAAGSRMPMLSARPTFTHPDVDACSRAAAGHASMPSTHSTQAHRPSRTRDGRVPPGPLSTLQHDPPAAAEPGQRPLDHGESSGRQPRLRASNVGWVAVGRAA